MILDQNIPFGHRPMHDTPHALAPVLDAYLARRAPEGIGAGIDRVSQNVVHDIVFSERWPADPAAVREHFGSRPSPRERGAAYGRPLCSRP